jgi:hypothetical protein
VIDSRVKYGENCCPPAGVLRTRGGGAGSGLLITGDGLPILFQRKADLVTHNPARKNKQR